jgi:type II secretory pathway pseudopilin PulG
VAVKWRQAGLTLIETVIAASLMVLVLMASLSILQAGLKWWQRGWDRMDAQQNARVALMQMTREIQAAKEIISGSDAGTLIIADAAGNQYKYLLSGDNLQRAVKKKGSLSFSGYNLLAYGVQTLEFFYDHPEAPENSKTVTIHLVTRDAGGRDFDVTTAVALRLRVMNPGG